MFRCSTNSRRIGDSHDDYHADRRRIGEGFFKRINNQFSSSSKVKSHASEIVRQRWKKAIQLIIERARDAKTSAQDNKALAHAKHGQALQRYPLATIFGNPMKDEAKRCLSMRITHAEARTTGMIAFLQFSPNGEHLATSSYDGNSRILDVKVCIFSNLKKGTILHTHRSLISRRRHMLIRQETR